MAGRLSLPNQRAVVLRRISVPCGLSEGLPGGLQIIGKFFDEGRVLQVASAYEGASGGGNVVAPGL
jgi:aspartyl-tRNA(Asn)/glutamyl-tRNA(Gln) amidotransferase subunit A